MTKWIVLAVIGWIICGFVAALIERGFWKRFYYEHTYVGWDRGNTSLMALFFILGPIGIITASISSLEGCGKIHIATHIPDEIRKPTRESQLLREAREMQREKSDPDRVHKLCAEIDRIEKEKSQKANELRKCVFI